MVENGVVADMGAMTAIHGIDGDRMIVDAGATWQEVLAASLKQGLTPPVLTNYLGLSVGGTIAVGGIGGSSSRYGMQTDSVLALDVVTGNGEEITCAPDRNSSLFDAVRGGLGQSAVVTRATLRLVAAPEWVRRFHLYYPDLAALAADQRFVLEDGRFDQVQGAVLPDGGGWRYQLDGAVFYKTDAPPDDDTVLAGLSDQRELAESLDLSFAEDAAGFTKLESALRSNGQWASPHPWLMSFLPGTDAELVAAEVLAELNGEAVGPFGRISFYPLKTNAFLTPLVRMPAEGIAFVFNLVRIPATSDATKIEAMLAQNRAIYERVRAAGGTLCPVSAFPMSPGDWRDHFGSAWSLLRDAKARFDPRHMLTPGYEVFSA